MKRYWTTILFTLLAVACLFFFVADILWGSVPITWSQFFDILHQSPSADSGLQHIIAEFRLPKALTACLCGAALAVAGQCMQTLFANPLAGPYVLGISSGASLGVAILLLGASFFPALFLGSVWWQILAAFIGALIVLLLVLLVSSRTTDTVSLLIVGMMFGSLAGALVSLLQSIADPESLKMYVVWSMGSLSAVTWDMMQIMAPVVIIGLVAAMILSKRLNALLLGENYASGLGVSIRWTRAWIIVITCLLAAATTAFTGPIAFVGMAVPHIARGLFKTTDHRIIIPASLLTGAALMLGCDILTQLPLSQYLLPINSVSSLIGAPIMLWVIIKNKHLHI